MGQFSGTFYSKGKTTTHPVYVVRELKTNLFGLPVITALRLAIRIDSTTSEGAETANYYKKQFPSLFTGLGNLKLRLHEAQDGRERTQRVPTFAQWARNCVYTSSPIFVEFV